MDGDVPVAQDEPVALMSIRRWVRRIAVLLTVAAVGALVVFLRGRFGRLGPFRGKGEYSGLGLGQDLAADQAFQPGASTFDVFG